MNHPRYSSGTIFFFRRFRRKNYAVFNSLHKIIHISTLIAIYSLIVNPEKLAAQKNDSSSLKVINLDEIEILGQKSPTSLDVIPRMVTVIQSDETESAASHSVIDLVSYTANIDLRQRGKDGIQSDLSIRGNSFDHNLILLNGINISDPQTGHLSLFLPVETDAIDRIEVLSGPAARVHGANAFAGAINFIVQPGNINKFSLNMAGGQHTYFNSGADVEVRLGNVRQGFHFHNGSSSGYTDNTDYRKYSLFYQASITLEEGVFDVQIGSAAKAFGANSFYSPRFPDQFEENKLSFFSAGYKTGKKITIYPQIYWRRHRDRFELFRENDRWYRFSDSILVSNDTSRTQYDTIAWYHGHNHHISDAYGAQMRLTTRTGIGKSTIGWHLRNENLISTNIGYDLNIQVPVRGYSSTFYNRTANRSNFDFFVEQTIELKRIFLVGGLLFNWNSYQPNEVNFFPGIDMRYFITGKISFFSSYNYTLGVPTFTDLTYTDPVNQGNNTLKPYTQHAMEAGFRYMSSSQNYSITGFYNVGKNVIDWVWFQSESRFRPLNINTYSGSGLELAGSHNFTGTPIAAFLRSLRFNYSFIDMNKDIPGDFPKYFNIRQKFSVLLTHQFFRNLTLSENFSYIQREGYYLQYNFNENAYQTSPFNPYFLVDIRLSCKIKMFTIFTEATNLLDIKYIDIGSVEQPGRWISAGFKFDIEGF